MTAPPRLLVDFQLVTWNGNLYETEIPSDLDVRHTSVSVRNDCHGWIAVHVIGRLRNTTIYCISIPLPLAIIRLQWRPRIRRMQHQLSVEIANMLRRVAVAMAFHPRLGAESALGVVDGAVVGAMVVSFC